MLKFNTAKLFRIVENIEGLNDHQAIIAMLEEDDVITSTMTLYLPDEIKHSTSLLALGQISEKQAENAQLTSPEWGYYINEDYEGWTIQELSNK
tara:strand:- start:833 stop:1114 length:282 start_codon:yes stop_codon:yes gene_type:complete